MRRGGEDGFTLIEVLVTLLILVVVLMGASSLFVNIMRATKQQSKIAESSMEGILGLDILRHDIEHAGFGLPWNGLTGYNEAAAGANAISLNPSSGTDAPRAFGSRLGSGLFGSDYFVVRAANVGMSAASRKWTSLRVGPTTRDWGSPLEDLDAGDRVIVLSPGLDNASFRKVVAADAAFGALAPFVPPDVGRTYIVYGIDNTSSLRMPFNRADYYIDTSNVPGHCAPNTGVFVKAVVGQTDGNLSSPAYPLLDCVASVKYRYRLDANADGVIDNVVADAGGLSVMTAQEIRDQVKEVQVFVLAHEGQRDPSYTHIPNPVNVAGTNVNVDPNFRWRLITMTVKPISLGP